MSETNLEEELQELSSAEEFLEYFGIQYDPKVVYVNRLHILQRFHDYLQQENVTEIADEKIKRQVYAHWLEQAYQDFVHSNAQTEKVFKVFNRNQAQEAFIPLEEIRRAKS